MERRQFIKGGLISLGAVPLGASLGSPYLFGAEEIVSPNGRKPFVLYIHMGSICGIASGLVQPLVAGQWPTGFFQQGAVRQANNPLLNQHIGAGSLILHAYNQCLAEIADDLCLVNGTPQTLDHNVARPIQMTGSSSLQAEWAMGVCQNSRTDANRSPLMISSAHKTRSTMDITTVDSPNIRNFKMITSDVNTMPKNGTQGIWNVLKNRYASPGAPSLAMGKDFSDAIGVQITTLTQGIPALSSADAWMPELEKSLGQDRFNATRAKIADGNNVGFDNGLKDKLILAGILAKSGLANGMTIGDGGHDSHNGGSEVDAARFAAGRWILLTQFWQWIKANGMDEDVMIIVSHEFGRSPYNEYSEKKTITGPSGQQEIVCPGRDHGLFMGMMFFNKNVPQGGRVGTVGDNLTPLPSVDTRGSGVSGSPAFVSSHIVGSMFMRVFPSLFPSERIVRKHWPDFKEIAPILR